MTSWLLSKGTSGTINGTVAVVDDVAAVVEDDGDCIRRERMTIPSPACGYISSEQIGPC